ncbi:Cytochrome P450 monooxygenase mpaDE [Paramyrothecium foliicola]|nr:Cytochrome P450 monooxygenase mpaDE [Paramyrothecium foliicola]
MLPALVNIPWSASTVSVSIIDAFQFSNVTTDFFMGPAIRGFETYNTGGYSFLIKHAEENIVFDLGLPPQLETDLPPRVLANVEVLLNGTTFNNPKGVAQTLIDGGVPLESIDTIIWSHTHWDHIGRPSLFPLQTDLVVGNGTLAMFGHGYPENPDSPYLSRELDGRTVREVEFSPGGLRIGELAAVDYFGDGSFYLLEAPGHEVGHINALARVTSKPPSFILLGADSFHHAAQLRPSRHVHLPKWIDLEYPIESVPDPLPRHLLYDIHPSQNLNSYPSWAQNLTSLTKSPFVTINVHEDGTSISRDPPIARDVISKLQRFDADDRILILAAHDTSFRDIIDVFPKKADGWKAKDWKSRGRWQFLADFEDALRLSHGK